MSLISEALRKARQQTAEDGDEGKGALYSWSPGARSRGARLGLGLVLGATIALGAALAGAGAVWWVVGRHGHSESIAQSASAEPLPPAPTSNDPLTADRSREATISTEPVKGVTTVARPQVNGSPARGTEPPAEPALDASAANLAMQPRPTPAADVALTTTRSNPTGPDRGQSPTLGPNGERIYIVEADLPGVTLTLDFIVFRSDDPFAEINGLEVHVGSTIEGFTVESIERHQVTLRDRQGLLILRAP